MLKDALSEIISNDQTCLLGLCKLDKSRYMYSIAPLNKNHLYPKNEVNLEGLNSLNPLKCLGEWSKNSNIFSVSGCFIDEFNNNVPENYVYSTNDWEIITNFSLSKENNNDNDYSIIALLNIDKENIPSIDNVEYTYTDENNNEITDTRSFGEIEIFNLLSSITDSTSNPEEKKLISVINELREKSTIQLFKQGDQGIVDIKFNIFKTFDKYFGQLYFNIINSDGEKIERVFNFNANYLVNKWNLFVFKINSHEKLLEASVNDGTHLIFELNTSFDPLNLNFDLNYPVNSINNVFKIGGNGTSKLKMKDVFVFNRNVKNPEIKFLTKLLNVEDIK